MLPFPHPLYTEKGTPTTSSPIFRCSMNLSSAISGLIAFLTTSPERGPETIRQS